LDCFVACHRGCVLRKLESTHLLPENCQRRAVPAIGIACSGPIGWPLPSLVPPAESWLTFLLSCFDSQVKRVGKYEIGKTLGEGTFGKVKFAVNTETGEKVAIKILDKEKIQKQNMGAQIKKEISIMKMVKHHNIVKLYEVLASRTKIFIVLELITGGELFDKIVAESRFDEKTARFYFRQLIKGVKYCHNQGVCHRDLKPENLLLDEHSDLKISDFGLSALYTGSADDEGRATVS
jgi:serine/threonine protein kinase